MTDRLELDGLRVQLPGSLPIYLIDMGKKRWIPNPQVYNALFKDWTGFVPDIDVPEITTGPDIPETAILFRCFDSPKIFLLDGKPPNQVKRHVNDPAVMERYNFDWNKVHVFNVPLDALKWPDGDPIKNPANIKDWEPYFTRFKSIP